MAYYFRLPTITQLTIAQQAALNETEPIALSGGPGTGKSVVSLYRHLTNHNNGEKSLLLTYTTTLKRYLAECCRLQNDTAANCVRTAYAGKPKAFEKFSEIIIDEAQDLDYSYYDGIRSFNVSYGADDAQILYPDHSSTKEELASRYPNNVDYVLDKNFRSTYRIMKFAKVAFPNAYIPQNTLDSLKNNIGEKPTLIVTDGTSRVRDNAIKEIIETFRSDTHNIAILVPFKKSVWRYHEILEEMEISHSMYYEDSNDFPDGCPEIDNVHITTFKSAKGLEFDTVILPDFGSMKKLCTNFKVVEWNDFYVAATRARANLYLFSNYDMKELGSVVERNLTD
jgi:superfamily I DNA/RNA helicase